MADVHDTQAHPISAEEMEHLYRTCVSLGDGEVRPTDLNQLLHIHTQKERASTMQPSNLEVAAPEHSNDGVRELARMASQWDVMRLSTAAEAELPDGSRMEYFKRNLDQVARLQIMWMRRLRAKEQSATPPPPQKIGDVVGGANAPSRKGPKGGRWR